MGLHRENGLEAAYRGVGIQALNARGPPIDRDPDLVASLRGQVEVGASEVERIAGGVNVNVLFLHGYGGGGRGGSKGAVTPQELHRVPSYRGWHQPLRAAG